MTDDQLRDRDVELGPEHERERERTPTSPPNPIGKVLPNPLSDTTTLSSEPPRPVLQEPAQGHPRTQRYSWQLEHPQLDTVNDEDEGSANTSPLSGLASGQERAQVQREEGVQDGTWSSNTLTLASQSSQPNPKSLHPKAPAHTQIGMDWEDTWERQKKEQWQTKVRRDLEGWRGGFGTPRSNYSPTAITTNSYFGSPITGTIGRDLPKEILRIERDWSGGEVCQFETSFPMELERRVSFFHDLAVALGSPRDEAHAIIQLSPTQLHDFVTAINTRLISAYSTKAAVVDNLIAIATWWMSLWFRPGHFETELRRIEDLIAQANKDTFNPVGLNVLSPRSVALQFLEIEYY